MIVLLALQAALVTGQAPPATPTDSLMARGVSRQLARYRAERISDVEYKLLFDVTRRDTLRGTEVVTFTRARGGDVILDFRGFGLGALAVNGVHVPSPQFDGAHIRIPEALLRNGENAVDIAFASPIAPAGASVIRFTDDVDKRDYLYTLLVPADANLLFPCFDQPDLKAEFILTLEVPKGWRALFNAPELERLEDKASDRIVFGSSKRISTYLFAFAAGPFATQSLKGSSLWVRASRAREAESDSILALNQQARDWMAGYFGIPYPFDKLDVMLAPAFPFGGMEHPGAIFYNEESFIYREPPTLTQRLGRHATIYHEVAHQWFGDFTTMRWFDDLWLKEGFATYMAAKMQDALGDKTAWMSFYLRNKPTAYDVDASRGTTSVWQDLANLDQAKSNYGAIVYNKAPGVLKQLNHLVGDSAFQRGVHDFLASHAYGNGTWQELIGAVGKAAGRNLASWGTSYFVRPGMPIVSTSFTTVNNRLAGITLAQRPAQPLSGAGAWPMKVDVLLYYDGKPPVILPVEMTSELTQVTAAKGLPVPDFIYANASDYGYGLFLMDAHSRDWLLSHHVPVADPFLRAMLWGSLWDLVREAALDPARYVEAALAALPAERNEQIASRLIGRVSRATDTYLSDAQRRVLLLRVESRYLAAASDTSLDYGMRKSNFDAFVGIASTQPALTRLDAWLDSASAAGSSLRQPSRWSIVTQLVSKGWPRADARLAAEAARDSSTSGKRRTFIASAAAPTAAVKRAYFDRYFNDARLNEDWVTASLGAFNDRDQSALTLPWLRPALDTLPWVQQNRRIFFLGSWLGSFVGGQRSADALGVVDAYLAAKPDLPLDLKQKILQSRDDLERTVRIRARFADPPRP